MAKTVKENKVAAAPQNNSGQGALLVEAIKGAISSGLAPLVTELKAASDRMNSLGEDMEELKGLHLIQAAAAREEEEDDEEMAAAKEDEDDEEMSAAKEEDDEEAAAAKKSDEEDDSEDDSDDDDGESDDLDAMEDLEKEAADQEPGEVNKDAENKGDKTSVTKPPKQGAKVQDNIAEGRLKGSGVKAWGKKPFPGLKSSGASIQAAAVMIESLQAQVSKLNKQNKRLVNQIEAQNAEFKKQMKKVSNKYAAMEAQAERWAEQVDRKSQVPVDLRNLMAKANVDPHDILAGNSEKLSVGAVDQMFRVAAEQGIQIDPTMRATYKNRMHELGLMESGEVPYSLKN